MGLTITASLGVVSLLVVALTEGSADQKITHTTLLYVCKGQPIELVWPLKKDNNHVLHTILYHKRAERMELLITKIYENVTLTDKRIVLRKGNTIIIYSAVSTDAGFYEWDVKFNNTRPENHKFHVTVNTGCPDFAKLHAPDLSYTIGKGDMERLNLERPVRLFNSTLYLKVIIPKAEPPITCTIKGLHTNVLAMGSSESTTDCLGAFRFEKLGKEAISVELEYTAYDDTQRSLKIISIDVSENASPLENTEEVSNVNSGSMDTSENDGDNRILTLLIINTALFFIHGMICMTLLLRSMGFQPSTPESSGRDVVNSEPSANRGVDESSNINNTLLGVSKLKVSNVSPTQGNEVDKVDENGVVRKENIGVTGVLSDDSQESESLLTGTNKPPVSGPENG